MSAQGKLKRMLVRARAELQTWAGRRRRKFRERRGVVERRRSATWQVAIALICATLGAAALGYLSIQLFFLPETVAQARLNRVPDLTGLDVEDAMKAGEASGYVVVESGRQFSEDVDAGDVLYQIPPPRSYLQRGDTLWILTSLGETRPVIPDLAGVDPEIARGVLARLGLETTSSRRAPSDLHPQGTVAETVPPAGTPIAQDTRVTLVISRGGSFLLMPDVTGLPLAGARDSLESFGLTVGEVAGVEGEQASGEASVVVVSQEPGPFRRVRAGSAIRLTLGEKPRPRAEVVESPEAAGDRERAGEDAVVEQPSAAERRRIEEERGRDEAEEEEGGPVEREVEPLPVPEPSDRAPRDTTP
ncbi:MAG: PASTA domain-containing protein [Gemmatimonadetes bacterium]|nr:PASTA domain-containing protein [Gemmatimonadota bacterium]